MVFVETTEEGRLFLSGIVLGKMNFSGHHYRQIALCFVIHAMPEYALSLVPGSGTGAGQLVLFFSYCGRLVLKKNSYRILP